ncbi:MAG: type II toxin-antitoxin system Phd/YefM family antitoxin [Chitinispirillaceae bacterium]|nr:type II toxin-antitoxin system Phd/YefM family antitoxin [Chitinispirillaceae bacterium]
MGMTWQIQDAKNKLSEVIEHAVNEGPQEITRHGKKTAVLLSMKQYMKLQRRKGSISDFFRNSPLAGIDLERKKDLSRQVDL